MEISALGQHENDAPVQELSSIINPTVAVGSNYAAELHSVWRASLHQVGQSPEVHRGGG